MKLATIIDATPQAATFGQEARTLARVPAGQGSRGRIVRLGSEHVKLFNRVRTPGDKGGELWSVAPLHADERASLPQPAPTPAPAPAPAPAAKPAPAVKPRRVLPGYDGSASDTQAPTPHAVKPSPMAAHVADLIGGYASEADERSDNVADNSDTERRAATICARMLRKYAADIRAGRVALA